MKTLNRLTVITLLSLGLFAAIQFPFRFNPAANSSHARLSMDEFSWMGKTAAHATDEGSGLIAAATPAASSHAKCPLTKTKPTNPKSNCSKPSPQPAGSKSTPVRCQISATTQPLDATMACSKPCTAIPVETTGTSSVGS